MVSHAAPPDATDPEILEYAVRHSLILLTQDLDYSAILARNRCSNSKRAPKADA
jgi:predicted nuclease of predicted toxin-antitoxin system